MAKMLSLVAAAKDYFGLNGKTSMDFLQEWKALSTEEKEWFKRELPSVGYVIQSTAG